MAHVLTAIIDSENGSGGQVSDLTFTGGISGLCKSAMPNHFYVIPRLTQQQMVETNSSLLSDSSSTGARLEYS